MSIIVIHGAQETGNSSDAKAFAEIFGVDTIIDDHVAGDQPFPTENALVLTRRSPDEVKRWRADSLRGRHPRDAIAFVPISTALRSIRPKMQGHAVPGNMGWPHIAWCDVAATLGMVAVCMVIITALSGLVDG